MASSGELAFGPRDAAGAPGAAISLLAIKRVSMRIASVPKTRDEIHEHEMARTAAIVQVKSCFRAVVSKKRHEWARYSAGRAKVSLADAARGAGARQWRSRGSAPTLKHSAARVTCDLGARPHACAASYSSKPGVN